MLLDFFNEQLPWRLCKGNKMNEVGDIKAKALSDPENFLWKSNTREMKEVRNIFNKIKELGYSDRPDYDFIKGQLNILLLKEEAKCSLYDTRETITVFFQMSN